MNTVLILLASFTLVAPDRTATVVLPEKPELSSELAATELTNYVARMTGNVLEVKKVGVENRCRMDTPSVVIGTLGTLKDVPAVIRTALDARTEDEAYWWVGTEGGKLWFVGKNETGELRGMYRFLEDKLGVRWFMAATKEDPGGVCS